ncbi:epoxide hydrolase family protein [Nakamurella lactea]|uniref:epoxide hydrolase family protein n=1 Tax=Nakamurella lactea TaxID=459515 RepID=UPI000422B69D|nr:epoxide hydrolase family protein [Nakamurella lactea]
MTTTEPTPTDATPGDITPFHIRIPDDAVADLRDRLRNTRLPAPLPGDGWDAGVPTTYLRHLVQQWVDFDWPGYQSRLNEFPQFTTEIDGQTIHFVHVRSQVPGATPLLLTHGWPGSFLEFLGLVGPLTDPAANGSTGPAFDVVIPSLPGFGFSTPISAGGWPNERIARAWVELMDRLGYRRFAAQGGDMGGAISPEIGRVAPERVVGVHVNGSFGYGDAVDEATRATMTPLEQDRLRRIGEFIQREIGYVALQGTRPALVGAMLTDSPVGQLAWIVDKLRAWTHPVQALPDQVLGLDFVLGNASLYWFTATAGSAAYVGYAQDGQSWGTAPVDSGVPTAAIQFAHDVGIRAFAEKSNTIARWTDVEDRGGHFAALEQPQVLLDDIREFFATCR